MSAHILTPHGILIRMLSALLLGGLITSTAIGLQVTDSDTVISATNATTDNPSTIRTGQSPTPAMAGGAAWTTYGAIQPASKRYLKPVGGNGERDVARFLVVTEPVSDRHILPFDRELPNTHEAGEVQLTATPGEYEPASLVIRNGPRALDHVMVTASDLRSTSGSSGISSANIDIRIVKAWFQSSTVMRRSRPRAEKVLVPELLLHDNSLVQVDFDNQTNRVRTRPQIEDSKQLEPFSIPSQFNQQLWLTLNVPDRTEPGRYQGVIRISGYLQDTLAVTKELKMICDVLPFRLPEPEQLAGQFYMARIAHNRPVSYSARAKSTEQMRAELIDMQQHGVRLVSLDHEYRKTITGKPDLSGLSEQIELMNQAGLDNRIFLYVDWKVSGLDDKEKYREKTAALTQFLGAYNSPEIWIYNRDEKDLPNLLASRHTFDAAHAVGAKNIVALTNARIADKLTGLLDIAVLQHETPASQIRRLAKKGVKSLAYGVPHAGEEKPATTRSGYGFELARKGFAGTLSYAYQSGECWNDWIKWETANYRPNVMAYPTIAAPIPTLQWEGWREGIDDLAYLAKYRQLADRLEPNTSRKTDLLATYNHPADSQKTRTMLIEKILQLLALDQ